MPFESKKKDFLILDKIFVLDNFNIALAKKYFVRADGRGKFVHYTICSSSYSQSNAKAPAKFQGEGYE